MSLEEHIRSSYPTIVEFNNLLLDRKTGIRFTNKLLPNVGYYKAVKALYLPMEDVFTKFMFLAMEDGIIDRRSLFFADVLKMPREDDQQKEQPSLFSSINHTTTALGNATLFRSLVQPLQEQNIITAKQNSLEEIASNDSLRQALDDYIGEFSTHEENMFSYLSMVLPPLEHNSKYRKFRKAARKLTQLPSHVQPETSYLSFLLKDVNSFTREEPYHFMRGPVYRTFLGLRSKEQRNVFLTPRWRYYPYPSWTFPPLLACAFLTKGDLTPYQASFMAMGILMGGIYTIMLKDILDVGTVIEPLTKKVNNHPRFQESMDSIGKIDELLSFYKFGKNFPNDVTIPKMTDDPIHSFVAKELRNPTLGIPEFVPNNISLKETYLNTITGPNSGGKTTICKSVVQNQILAQIGSYVTAKDATINITDHIAYQAPMFDALKNPEGRFGTEMEVTKNIYFSTTPKSLVVLDELAEGTTMEERMEQSYDILDDFYKLQANTLWVTHNHQLADTFRQEGRGQYLQVEFKDSDPTHRIIEGISTQSHADRVMEKINFTSADRADYRKKLESEGILRKK